MDIRKMDGTGTDIEAETAHEAAQAINEHRKAGGWAFIDGRMVNTDEVTEADLEGAERAVLSPAIRGG